MQNNLFRKKSLDNLSSPEQLDTLVQNVPSRGWIALATLAAIVFITILWSIYGLIPTKVQGNGILLKTSGIGKVYSTTSGMIKNIYINNGDEVKKGDLIATVSHPSRVIKVETTKDILNKLKEKYKKQSYQGKHDLEVLFGTFQREKKEIKSQIKSLFLKIKNIKKKIKNQEKLNEKGLITYQTLLKSKELLLKTQNDLRKAKNSLVLKNVEAFGKKRESEDKLEELNQKIISVKRDLRALVKNLKLESEIRSNYNGKVFEIPISEGTVINNGTNIAEIEKTGDKNDLEVVFFVSAMEGKMVEKSFVAQVSPSTVKKEEFGFIQASVKYVSSFPATRDALMNILNNNELTTSFLRNGPPIIIYAKLNKNADTFSGFQWSSSKGPEIYVTSGTLSSVEVTVRQQAPISLVIPMIKKGLGL